MGKGILFIMSGPSGTGKGTICGELLKRHNIFLSISNTTREMRVGEKAGVTYNYVSVDEFETEIEKNGFLEYAKYGENYYGTPKAAVYERLQKGEDVLLEIEPQGALKVKGQMPEAVMIFVVPPSVKELKKRLTERGREDEEQIKERIEAAKWEFSQAEKYNHICVNDDLEKCVFEVSDIIKRTHEQRDFAQNLLSEIY